MILWLLIGHVAAGLMLGILASPHPVTVAVTALLSAAVTSGLSLGFGLSLGAWLIALIVSLAAMELAFFVVVVVRQRKNPGADAPKLSV